jgi:hypothetical protein
MFYFFLIPVLIYLIYQLFKTNNSALIIYDYDKVFSLKYFEECLSKDIIEIINNLNIQKIIIVNENKYFIINLCSQNNFISKYLFPKYYMEIKNLSFNKDIIKDLLYSKINEVYLCGKVNATDLNKLFKSITYENINYYILETYTQIFGNKSFETLNNISSRGGMILRQKEC